MLQLRPSGSQESDSQPLTLPGPSVPHLPSLKYLGDSVARIAGPQGPDLGAAPASLLPRGAAAGSQILGLVPREFLNRGCGTAQSWARPRPQPGSPRVALEQTQTEWARLILSTRLLSIGKEGTGGLPTFGLRKTGLRYWTPEEGGHWGPGFLVLCPGVLETYIPGPWAGGNITGSYGRRGLEVRTSSSSGRTGP